MKDDFFDYLVATYTLDEFLGYEEEGEYQSKISIIDDAIDEENEDDE